jgi:alpha-tubulin suppressor-like RCC1 family protein
MSVLHRHAVWQFAPYLFLFLAGCVPAEGVFIEITGTALDGETVRSIPAWTPSPSSTLEPSPVVTATSTPLPTPASSHRAFSIAAGRSHTCVVTTEGGVLCWGKNEHGELGNGTWSGSRVPMDVPGLTRGVRYVAAGWGHTCVLTWEGGVKCWGYNKNGELGDGTNTDSNRPVSVRGLEHGVESIEAADDHTCAVLVNGSVKCWGFNLYGQLGDGTAVDRNVPVDVVGLTRGVAAVAAGWGHTCAMMPEGGVKCWGNNHYGQLGIVADQENIHTPVNVSGLAYGVTEISADGGQTCVLTYLGLTMCWGNNKYGQLGDGTSEVRNTPVVVAGMFARPVRIVAGWNHTCAVDGSKRMFCWGWNFFGQLGDGIRTTSAIPVTAGKLMSGVLRVAAGWAHTCVITDRETVQCWGLNDFGQVGDGTTGDAYLPVTVTGFSG